MNKVILLGRIGGDPETRDAAGSVVARAGLATTETWKDQQGQKKEKTTWHNLNVWGKLGSSFANHVKKGMKVLVEGKITINKRDVDGRSYTNVNIKVDNYQIVDWNNKNDSQQGPKPAMATASATGDSTDDDLPF